MENQIQLFSNPEFGQVRVVDIDGEPWLVGKDVATALGYKEPAKAIREHVPDNFKGVSEIDTPGGKQKVIVINEAGMYKLVLRSKLPNAEKFSDWTCGEVLPSIRKHGAYLTVQTAEKILYNPDFIIKLAEQVKQAQLERDQFKALADEQEVTIKALKPKADYCALILQSDEALPTRTIADDYGWSAQHLNNVLKDFGIIYKAGKSWLVKQVYRGRGYTVKIPSVIKGGHTVTNTYWTQKGRMFIYTVLKKRGVLPLCERDENMPALF